MGAYSSTYTSDYPSAAGLVAEGYSFPQIVLNSLNGVLWNPEIIGQPWSGEEHDFFGTRVQLASVPAVFVRVSGVWSRTKRIPATYDKFLGGGYNTPATLADLDGLLAAGLLTQEQYDTALLTADSDNPNQFVTEAGVAFVTEGGVLLVAE